VSLYSILWLFPVLFVIHAFEEIIMLRATRSRFRRNNRVSRHSSLQDNISTPAYCFELFIRFLVVASVTFVASFTQQYVGWFALFAAFALSLLVELLRLIRVQRYLPGAVSCVLLLPACAVLLVFVVIDLAFRWPVYLLSVLAGVAVQLILRMLLQIITPQFESWLEMFADKP